MRLSVADVIVVALALYAAHRGWRRGLLGQVFELGGGFLGLLGGIAIAPRVAALFSQEAGLEAALLALLAVVLGLSLGQTLGHIVGHRFGHAARRARLGGVDSGLGSLFGGLVIFVSYWLIGSLLLGGPVQAVARSLKRSAVLRAMNDVAPPPDVLAYVRQYLVAADFPQVFLGVPPPSGAPVARPESRVVRRAQQAAQASTVRILAEAPDCGGTQLGSGWISGDSTVVTNAHVVAGGQEVSVIEGSTSHAGSVVLFDPAADIAVVRVDALDGPPLELSTEPLSTGAPGAILGHPGGGRLLVRAAAVQKGISALGLDIYGTHSVRRDVLELRARVHEGDSGGPFVRPNGRVAGTVFAASSTDPRIGYALSGEEIADEVERAARSEDPVSTGGCTR